MLGEGKGTDGHEGRLKHISTLKLDQAGPSASDSGAFDFWPGVAGGRRHGVSNSRIDAHEGRLKHVLTLELDQAGPNAPVFGAFHF